MNTALHTSQNADTASSATYWRVALVGGAVTGTTAGAAIGAAAGGVVGNEVAKKRNR
jgi:hypothetical protein